MQRVRRLAPIVTVALLTGVVLAGCRSAPDVAAYVGSDKITEEQVDDIVNDFAAKRGTLTPEQLAAGASQTLAREDVVMTLVLQEVCEQFQAEKGFASVPVTPAQVAESGNLPVGSLWAQERATLFSCTQGMPEAAPVTPTEAELKALYDELVAIGAADPAQAPFETVKADLAQNQDVLGAIANQRLFADAMKSSDVTVNPRYRPLELPLLTARGNEALISVPLGEGGNNAVVKAPATAGAPLVPAS
ncbi:hypothetical protein GCM10009682_62480 [Luedemannella flava]|uniref:Lipoprotein n=1 Tax=Luedemannella flava TaxID=349316 RepID=A0ABN2MSS6_9ACTN